MKKFLKVIVWAAGIIVVLLLLVVVAAKLFLPAEKIKQLAIEKGSAMLGREISVESLDISIWGGLGVELQNVRIGNPPGMAGPEFLATRSVDLKLRLLPLLSGETRVSRLILDDPVINMHKQADGQVNYSFSVPDSALPPEAAEMSRDMAPEARPAAAAISFDRLDINNGRLIFVNDSTGLNLGVVNLKVSTSLENPRGGFFSSAGRIQLDTLTVSMGEAYPPVGIALNYKVDYDFATKRAAIERAELTLNQMRLRLSGEVLDPMGTPSARLNIVSEEMAIADLLSMVPPAKREAIKDFSIAGNFALNADIEYKTEAAVALPFGLLYSGTATLSDARLSRTGINGELTFAKCLVDFKPDNVRANLENGSFDGQPFKGHVLVENFADPSFSGELAGSVNLAFVQPFLPAKNDHRLSGQTTFDLKFAGRKSDLKNMAFSGNLRVDQGAYQSALVPEPIQQFTLDAYFDNHLLNVRTLDAMFPSGNLSFTGRISDAAAYFMADSLTAATMRPPVEGNIKGQVNLAMANSYLPKKGSPKLAGQLALDLSITGTLGDMATLRPRGSLEVTDASYTDSLLAEPITHLAAKMTLTPDTIAIGRFDVKFVSSDASFTGQLVRPFPYLLPDKNLDRSGMQKPFLTFALSSHRFDTDKLFPEAVPGAATDPTKVSPDSVSIVLLPDIEGKGTLKADTVIYCAVEFTQVDAKVKIYDRKIEVYDGAGKVYTGSVAGNTTVDLNDFENPRYSGQFEASQVEVNDFVQRFSKFGGYLFGKADLNGNYDAQGWDPEAFKKSLNMNGKGDLRDGKLVTSGVVYNLLNALAQKAGGSMAKEQAIKGLVSNIIVKDGRVKLDNLTTSIGSIGDLSLGGYYGFDGSLEYSGQLKLTEEQSQALMSQLTKVGGSGLTSLLGGGKAQRITLPLKIGGTITDPKPEVDYSAIQKSMGENLKDNLGNFLQGLTNKKKDK